MSGEDDTFDIDIYGDENEDTQATGQNGGDPDDNLIFDDDADDAYNGNGESKPQDGANGVSMNEAEGAQKDDQASNSTSQPAQQGVKRKAEDDQEYDEQRQSKSFSQSVDPNATPALKLSELHWWTTEEDLRAFCASAKVEDQLRDLSFGEHKINGKSRGEAYLEFSSPQAADAVKKEIEKKEGAEAKRLNPFQVWFTTGGNPFKGRDSGAQGKKDLGGQQHGGRGGAYNQNFASQRGGFRGGFNRGGGFNSNRGGFQQQQNAGGWNASGMGMNPMMTNPMMNNPMMQNPMMMGMAGAMGGFGNMGRGGMMGGGRGGFGMGARGGFGGGFQQQQQGYGGGGGYGMQGGQANKRFKEG